MNFHGHPSWDSCILITSKNLDNQRFGTGFLVHHSEQKSYIVTCAHVISDVGGTDLIEADGKSAAVVNIGADDGLDLAVIEIDKLLSKPIIKLKVLGIAGSSFLTVGWEHVTLAMSIFTH
jgi:S1-C subfamily serine protease